MKTIQGADFTVPEDCSLKYVWVAEYSDGSYFSQFDEKGVERLFGDIEQDKLIKFHMCGMDSPRLFTVLINDSNRLICFRRHMQKHCASPVLHSEGHDVLYVLGFQKTVKGVNFKSMMFIDVDGNVKLVDENENEKGI